MKKKAMIVLVAMSACCVASALVAADTLHDGVDVTRMPRSPGVHIVALEDSPFIGATASAIREQIAEQSAKGSHAAVGGVPPDLRAAVSRRKRSAASAVGVYATVAEARPHLLYEPTSVAGTIVADLPLSEAATSGGLKDGRWTGLSRSWDVAGLGIVQLEESEYAATGGSITMIKEWLNADVNGYPATLQSVDGGDGASRVSVGWVTDRKVMRLDLQPVGGKATKEDQETLLALARSLGT